MTGIEDQIVRELLALTRPDQPDRRAARVRELLADAWNVGYGAGRDDEAVQIEGPTHNPFSGVECPSCGVVAHRVSYNIGDGPEYSCQSCEWCWGANGQPLTTKPLDWARNIDPT